MIIWYFSLIPLIWWDLPNAKSTLHSWPNPYLIMIYYSLFVFFININLFILIGGQLLFNIVVVLPYTDLSQPWEYMYPHPEPPSHLPSLPIPQGHPGAPALSILSHASNLDWRSVSHSHWILNAVLGFQCQWSHELSYLINNCKWRSIWSPCTIFH